jgi:hypothetical protein
MNDNPFDLTDTTIKTENHVLVWQQGKTGFFQQMRGSAVIIADTGVWVGLADRRDFQTYRWKNRQPFTNLLEPLP